MLPSILRIGLHLKSKNKEIVKFYERNHVMQIKHTFLCEEGTWDAYGYYTDMELDRLKNEILKTGNRGYAGAHGELKN